MNLSSRKILDSAQSPEPFTVRIPTSKEIMLFREKIIMTLTEYGAVIVEFEMKESPRDQLLCFVPIFGSTMSHDRADKDMIAEIAVSDQFQGYLGTSNAAHPFHTDGAYDDNPPPIIALRCEVAATSGGITQLVSGEAIYHYLEAKSKKLTDALFNKDVLRVERAGKKSSQPIFRKEKGRILMRYRSDNTSTIAQDPDVVSAIEEIKSFLSNKKNCMTFSLRPLQVLITDNTRVLHARSAFTKNEPRVMHRLFFSGDKAITNGFIFGFLE